MGAVAATAREAARPAATLSAAEAIDAAITTEVASRCYPPDAGHQIAAARKLLPAAVGRWEKHMDQ